MRVEISIILIALGILLVLVGILYRFDLIGKLPGDFSYSGNGWRFYFPLATSIILSILLTIIILIIRQAMR